MSSTRLFKLRDIASIKGGKRLPNGEPYSPIKTKHPYLRVCDFENRCINCADLRYITEETHKKISRYVISKDDVYISIAGTIGLVGSVPDFLDGANLTENAAKIVIHDPNLVLKEYLIWYLATVGQSAIASSTKATSQPKLALFRIEELEIPLPPIEEQRRIAAILDKADALRAKRREALSQLDRLAQSIFVEMFGDPVTNPKGWPLAKFETICDRVTVGIVVKPASYYRETGVPALRSLNIKPGKIVLDDLVFFSKEDNSSTLKKTKLKTSDIVIVRTGQPGTAAVVPPDFDGFNAIDILIATPKKECVNPTFLCEFLNSQGGRSLVLASQRGQVQKHLNVGELNAAPIPMPSIELQNQYAETLKDVISLRSKIGLSAKYLDEMFSSLQHRAFQGTL